MTWTDAEGSWGGGRGRGAGGRGCRQISILCHCTHTVCHILTSSMTWTDAEGSWGGGEGGEGGPGAGGADRFQYCVTVTHTVSHILTYTSFGQIQRELQTGFNLVGLPFATHTVSPIPLSNIIWTDPDGGGDWFQYCLPPSADRF